MASIPEFLTQALQAQYGETLAAQILAGYACVRPVTLRVNTLKAAPEDVQARLTQAGRAWEAVPGSPEALILPHCREDVLEALPMYQQGEIYLQSLSSMLPPVILSPKEGESILDMAAAPGGKTTQMAAMTGGKVIRRRKQATPAIIARMLGFRRSFLMFSFWLPPKRPGRCAQRRMVWKAMKAQQ